MEANTQPVMDSWLTGLLHGIFTIQDITSGALNGQAVRIRGRMTVPSRDAYNYLAPRCKEAGYTLLFRREDQLETIYLVRGITKAAPSKVWLPLVLGIATIISVVFSYLFYWETPTFTWDAILQGLPRALAFAVPLLAILLTHELGHYFTAKKLGVAVTFPFLVPFPLSPFGTMGAVIRMKDVAPSRRSLLLIGAAGPLAGLLVTIPVLLIGLSLSKVVPPPVGSYIIEGNSLLYWLAKYLVFGKWLPAPNLDVFIHPMAFAGWAGVLVTSMNLMPAGQLDGGHIAYALLGAKARYVMWVVLAILVALGFWWPGWWLWAVLVFFLGRNHPSPLDDLTILQPKERLAAILVLVLFLLTFTPLPMTIVQ
ncbi:MAG: site-2 protease family protein [Anaerolineae bacterium]